MQFLYNYLFGGENNNDGPINNLRRFKMFYMMINNETVLDKWR